MDYSLYFEDKVNSLIAYLQSNNIKAMILGISGGIDSTVCAAICHEVSKRTGIPLIGRSLPTRHNKEGEITTADLVGKAFCDDYSVYSINDIYQTVRDNTVENPIEQTLIADGNIQARLRMIYLYNLASVKGGLVIDTDNLTEHNLGYFTIHGDVGDVCLLHDLWKTQVFELAKWLLSYYSFQLPHNMYEATSEQLEKSGKVFQQGRAIRESLKLKPTAGLGITDSDLDELGAESYEQVDDILQEILAWKSFTVETNWNLENFLDGQQMLYIPIEIIKNVATRHFNSEFKRKHLPIRI